MKIYTKTGDTGTTALFGGTRVPKDHIRIESYGTVDELNSHIGLLRDQEMDAHYKEVLIEVQDRLFNVGAILATPPEKAVKKNGELRLQNLGIIDSDIEFTKTLGIRGVPTIKAYKSGDEVFSKSGVLQREELLNVGKMVM
jgi:cob(I)alamin adenosyltransferase